ncbi:hypothetical protein O0L34_g15263 [Tuta absoluta]|nr:hypothetical protein O0L34_g15263 [Tuta absoluta]
MYFPLVFLGAVALASAWPETNYETTLQEGLQKNLETHKWFVIPSGVCDEYISTYGDGDEYFHCENDWEHVVTLRVSADDIDASPDINFKSNLNKVFITRQGTCFGDSNVKLSFTCASFGDVERSALGLKDNVQTKTKVGYTRENSNRRILNQFPYQ